MSLNRAIPSYRRLSDVSLDKTGIEIGASRALTIIAVALHAGAIAVSVLLPVAWWLRAILALLVVANGYLVVSRHTLRFARSAIVAFAMEQEGDACRWRYRAAADWVDGQLIDRWVRAPLTLLVLRRKGKWWPVSLVLAADAVAPEAFRRLRVRLTLRTAEE